MKVELKEIKRPSLLNLGFTIGTYDDIISAKSNYKSLKDLSPVNSI